MVARMGGNSDRRASNKAIARASALCPVIIKLNNKLDSFEPLDLRHAVEILRNSLCFMPEGSATRDLLNRLLDIEDSLKCTDHQS